MNLHSYPKIFAIGHKAVQELFDGPVLVEEKIDGSQFSFGVIDGKIEMRSRGCAVLPEAAGMFNHASTAVQELAPKLFPGVEFVKDKLVEWALPRILRASTAGLPEWYKERLLDSAFQSK